MGTSIDTDVSIYAGDNHQEVLAWLRENDELGFEFHQPFMSVSGQTVIAGNICEYVSNCFDDEARAFFQAVHERFGVRIALDIRWPDYDERQLIYLGELGEIKAVEHALDEMLERLGQIEIYPPDKLGELAGGLDSLQASIEAIRDKARATLQDAWR